VRPQLHHRLRGARSQSPQRPGARRRLPPYRAPAFALWACAMRTGHHEDLARDEVTAGPSNRSFGLTIAVVFALVAALELYRWSPWGPCCGRSWAR
jgi:hypothetical protein